MEMISLLNKLSPSASEKRILVSMSNKGPLQRGQPRSNPTHTSEHVKDNNNNGSSKPTNAPQVEIEEPFPPAQQKIKTSKMPLHQKKFTNDEDDLDIDKLIFASNKTDDDFDAMLNVLQQRNKHSKKPKQMRSSGSISTKLSLIT